MTNHGRNGWGQTSPTRIRSRFEVLSGAVMARTPAAAAIDRLPSHGIGHGPGADDPRSRQQRP